MSNCLPPGERTLISDRHPGRPRATTERTLRKRVSMLAMVYRRIVAQAPLLLCGLFRLTVDVWSMLGVLHPLCWEAGRTTGGPDPKPASRESQSIHREQDARGPRRLAGRPAMSGSMLRTVNISQPSSRPVHVVFRSFSSLSGKHFP